MGNLEREPFPAQRASTNARATRASSILKLAVMLEVAISSPFTCRARIISKFGRYSSEARYTVTRITLFRFADTTSASVPQSKDFPGARESASSPAVAKNNVPETFAPRTATLYHFPSPRVNAAAPKTQIPHRAANPVRIRNHNASILRIRSFTNSIALSTESRTLRLRRFSS